jgi:PAS domain S-box-containing protein
VSVEAVWEEDFTRSLAYLLKLRKKGIHNFREYFTDYPEELITCLKKSTISRVNPNSHVLFQISDDEELIKYRFRFFSLDSLSVFKELLVSVFEGSKEFSGELQIITKQGIRREISIFASVLPFEESSIKKVLMFCVDISDINKRQMEHKRIICFLIEYCQYLNIPLIVWNCAHEIEVCNSSFAHLTGLSANTAIGKNIDVLFPSHHQENVQQLIKMAEEGVEWEGVTIPVKEKSGQVRDILWNSAQVTNSFGEVIAFLTQGQDVTEQRWAIDYMKRYIAELIANNEELQTMRDQLEEINQNLDDTVQRRTQEMEELLTQKDEFITQIGHDLKTPLTPILAIVPVLIKKEQDPKKKNYLEVVNRNAHHLQALLTSIIQMARLNKTYVPRGGTLIPVSQMIDELVVNYEFAILKKRLHVMNEVPDTLNLWISPIDFDTIFENIIDNAIKFTGPDGVITFFGKESDEGIFLRITDSGIGLLPEDRVRIFDKFYKADPSRHDGTSHGLGLSITQTIVERNGGIIRVESEGKDAGTSFILYFPNRNIWCSERKHEVDIDDI